MGCYFQIIDELYLIALGCKKVPDEFFIVHVGVLTYWQTKHVTRWVR